MTWVARPGSLQSEKESQIAILPVDVRITDAPSHPVPPVPSHHLRLASRAASDAAPSLSKEKASAPSPLEITRLHPMPVPSEVVSRAAPTPPLRPSALYTSSTSSPPAAPQASAPPVVPLGKTLRERARDTAVGTRCWDGAAPDVSTDAVVHRQKIAAPRTATSSDSLGGVSGNRVRSGRPSSATSVRSRDERMPPKRWRSLHACDSEGQCFGGFHGDLATPAEAAAAELISLPPTPARGRTPSSQGHASSSNVGSTAPPPLRSRRRDPWQGQHAVEAEGEQRSVPTIFSYCVTPQSYNLALPGETSRSDVSHGGESRGNGTRKTILAAGPPRRAKQDGRSRPGVSIASEA
jgi:hypothetical protein